MSCSLILEALGTAELTDLNIAQRAVTGMSQRFAAHLHPSVHGHLTVRCP